VVKTPDFYKLLSQRFHVRHRILSVHVSH